MKKFILIITLLASTNVFSESVLNRAWEVEDSTIVIDAYEHNSINWKEMKKDKKMAAVIHRSTDGLRVDKKYKSRNEIAINEGYLWGAYHLGRPGNVIKQAKLFLEVVGDNPDTLLVLDLEATSNKNMMSIKEAVIFMNYVYEETGKIPVVYANHNVTKELNRKLANNRLFKKSQLWYARFRSDIPKFPTGIWDTYFLWQFSSEINCKKTGTCLYNVPGTRFDMDVNVFYGTKEELEYNWINPT